MLDMLLLDRFLGARGTALDLATGAPVRTRLTVRATDMPLYFARDRWRLVDAGPRPVRGFVEVWARASEVPAATPLPIDAVRAALHDARDGCPRALDLGADDVSQWRRTAWDIAREARLAGFVPIAIGVLGEVLREQKWRWPRWLADRSLVVITCDGEVSAPGALALLRLASRDARPHLVIRGATRRLSAPRRLVPSASLLHESPPDDPCRDALSPGVLAERAWQHAVEDGRADDETAAAARWAIMLAPSQDTEASARAALSVTLAAQGRVLEARAALPDDTEMLSAVAARRAADARARVAAVEQPRRSERVLADDFLRVLETCQSIEDEATTVSRVVAMLRDRVAASGVACFATPEARGQVLAHVGTLVAEPAAVHQSLVSGLACRPRPGGPPSEGAWPIRYGGTVVGVLWCRWSVQLPVLESDADGLLTLAAAALAPAVAGLAARLDTRAEPADIPELVGQSEAMGQLRAAVRRAARSPFPVLIEGESGSGKELVARAIHRMSPRGDRRFSAINCAALSEELAEAELFGHARGAFTGALTDRAGLFEASTGGTLFLDEVSELSLRIQAKLLRVLQEHEVRRLGESHARAIDTRIVAATNRPLEHEVTSGRFRRDLRYRLDVVRLTIPPLRERLEDLPALVRHIWTGLAEQTASRATLAPAALAVLGRYDWPGNVRELQNVLASLIVSSPPRGAIPATLLPGHIGRAAVLDDAPSLAAARQAFERRYVTAALARANGRSTIAARDLGVSRQGLAKVIARLGLDASHLAAVDAK